MSGGDAPSEMEQKTTALSPLAERGIIAAWADFCARPSE